MNESAYIKYKELIIGIIITMFAGAYLIGSCFIERTDIVSLGGEFMPQIYGTFLLVLAILQVIKGIRAVKGHIQETDVEKSDIKNVILMFAIIIAYVAVMNIFGFVLSSVLLMMLMSLILTPANVKIKIPVYVIFAVALPVIAYYLFRNFMNVNLPVGIIFGG